MKTLNYLKLTLYTLLFALLTTCSDDDKIQYQLTTQVTPAEAGTLTPVSGMYNEGTEVELKATPNQEYVFKNWTGDASGNVNPLKIIMLDDKNITAVFEKVNYALTLDIIGEGTVNQEIVLDKSTSKDYESGTTVQLTAVPDDEWRFVEWSGDHTGTENPIQLTMDQAMSITAKFEKVSYALTIEIEGNGTVNEEIVQAKSTTDYDSGTTVKLTAIPDDGWIFVGWSGDHTGTENPIQLTMDEPMSITAKFENTWIIPISIWLFGGGTIEKEWVGDPELGNSQVRLTARAQEGYYFVHLWGVPDENSFGDLLTTENPLEFDLNQALMTQNTDHLFLYAVFNEINTDKTSIPDDHFEQALIDLGYDDQLDGYASTQVISRIEEMDISNRNIQDLSGLED
ncbi:InlB B-repeat-containing protein, partial [Lutimonas sp.]|uniref:InlB B-repeat-containing protein n=1 Tax=Lutimonas sp. TaxID=1872403 RepID=UPI003C783344